MPEQINDKSNVSEEIFRSFICSLEDTDAPKQVVEQLRKSLLEDQNFTENALQDAILTAIQND